MEPQPGAAWSIDDCGLSSLPTGLPRDPETDVSLLLLTHLRLGGSSANGGSFPEPSDTDRKPHLRKKDLGSGALGDLTWVTQPRGA